MEKHKSVNIVIPAYALFGVVFLPLILYLVWWIKDIVFSLLIAFIIMSALQPGVSYLVARKTPRPLAVGIVFALFLLFFISLFSLIIPPIIIETTNLIRILPQIMETTIPYIQTFPALDNIFSYFPSVTNNVFGVVTAFFTNTLFVMTTLFFSLYFLLEENLTGKVLHHYLPKKTADRLLATLKKAEHRMSSWFWGELTLMTVVGVLTYIGLTLVGVKYALPLAVFAGLLEVVPNIGPIISAVPAMVIGFSQSYFAGFSTLSLYIIVQQLENNLIVPMIMRRAVGINPIITLLALLVGGRLGGVLGVLLAVPAYLFIETIVEEYLRGRHEVEGEAKK